MAATNQLPTNASLLTGQQPQAQGAAQTGGPSSQRPANPSLGQLYYDTTLSAEIVWSGTVWALVAPGLANNPGYGNTAGRPPKPFNGQLYFNTDLSGLEAWNSSAWVLIGPIAGAQIPTSPFITKQPVAQTVTAGQNVVFTVVATGTAPLSYQWYFNAAPVGGATSASYTITNVNTGQAGNYYVVVTNGSGTATSVTEALTVNASAPSFSCLSFVSTAVASSLSGGGDCISGWTFINAGAGSTISVTTAATNGNLPAGTSLSIFDSQGNFVTSSGTTGGDAQLSCSYVVTNSGSGTAVVQIPATTPTQVATIVGVVGGAAVFVNASVRAWVYGSIIFPPSGFAVSLQSTTVAPGSVASADFVDSISGNYKTAPSYSWNFNGNTVANPYVDFSPGGSITLTGYVAGAQAGDVRLDINPP